MPNNLLTEMEGVEMTNEDAGNPPLMTPDEKRVLELYERLEELQSEIALLKAGGVLSQDQIVEGSEGLQEADAELLKAKALHQVRNNIIKSVLIANPILKAVHSGSNASIIEQDLLPLIQKRDTLSISLSELSSKVQSAQKDLETVELENIAITKKNVELSAKMLALAEEAAVQRKEDISDPKTRQQLDELEAEMRISRQRFRVMKATAIAIIAGSGIDWARDPELLEIVLDED
ncbi:hypothetical protein D0Z07_3957 [Hyphodiscus hymeniophilus]|uniref:Centromere protein H C-terminal domain-containing protein n=1 Tax=Hyphodiscus hymeniophilus TaxID=353542 RepID=A0A9P7AY66_9HELO|nr:hypothetical protein D0Z07_3957 [Hyphodiscus hymeniophilus]